MKECLPRYLETILLTSLLVAKTKTKMIGIEIYAGNISVFFSTRLKVAVDFNKLS